MKTKMYQQISANLRTKGQLRRLIPVKFPLTQAGVYQAHELSESHHAAGKIILVLGLATSTNSPNN